MPLDLPAFLTREQHRIHLVGVAGSGMSGIAALLIGLGHTVSGSDKVSSMETDRLQRLGLRFRETHRPEDAGTADLVVFSSAIKNDNPILVSARNCGKPIVRRAEALAAIMRSKRGIVIAGMHGKTTTSAMTAHALREGGLHPSHYVGAEIPILGTNAHWDPRGEHFVAEGDESDGTIALFHPEHALILNIEEEHLDFYADLDAIEKVFAQLIAQTAGKVFYNVDDKNSARLCRSVTRGISYGFDETADYRAVDIRLKDFASTFRVNHRGQDLGEAALNVPGQHNVHNALGVIALASELGIAFEKIAKSLAKFEHARRRFEIKYDSPRFLLVDDYGHHPTEIRATLKAARSVGRKRVLTMFQPHRYSRTKALRKAFGRAFDDADRVVVTDVYGSNESPIPGVTGQMIADEIVAHGHRGVSYESRLEWVHRAIGNMLESGDLVLSLGAGNIHEQLSGLAADLVIAEKLKEIVGEDGEVCLYEPLSKHTTLRVGGPAQFWVEPRNEKTFAELIRFCRRRKSSALRDGSRIKSSGSGWRHSRRSHSSVRWRFRQDRDQLRRDHRGRWGEIERSRLRGQSGRHWRAGVVGRNSGHGRRRLAHERGRDGRANFRERCECSLPRCEWRGAHKNTGRIGSVLPEFPVAGEKFCSVRRFSRRACTA